MPLTIEFDHAPSVAAVDQSTASTDDGVVPVLVAIGVRVGAVGDDAPGVDAAVLAGAGFTAKVGQSVVARADLVAELSKIPAIARMRAGD